MATCTDSFCRRGRGAVCLPMLCLLLAAGGGQVARAGDVVLEHHDVFVNGESIEGLAYNTFRIPNIARTNDGTLIAVAEARLSNSADPGGTHIDLVYKRSTDGGRSWSEGRLLDRHPETTFNDTGLPTNRTSSSNSVSFVDRRNGRLWVMNMRLPDALPAASVEAGVDDMQTWAHFSDDNGVTWADPRRITLPQYEDFYPNLGSATQLANGRLLIPATEIIPRVVSKSFAMYSDDQGGSWYAGELVDAATNEAQITELTDGRLLMTARQNGGNNRVFAFSYDEGASWQPSFTGFTSTRVMEAIERFEPSGPDGERRSLLLHTKPAGGPAGARTNLDIMLAADETSPGGPGFGNNRRLFNGYAAYSDLAAIDSEEVGVLWETGDTTAYGGIVYTRFNDTFLEPAPESLGLVAHEGFAYTAGRTLDKTRDPPPGLDYLGGYAPVDFSARTDLDLIFSVGLGSVAGEPAVIDAGVTRNDQANGILGQVFTTGPEAGPVTEITIQRAPNGSAGDLYLHLYADTDLSDGIDPASFLGSSVTAASLSPTDSGFTRWTFADGATSLLAESRYLLAFARSPSPGDTTTARASLAVAPATSGYGNGGNGFNSAWHATAADLTAGPGAAAVEIVAGNLEHAGLGLPAEGNHARLSAGGSLARGLGVGLDLDANARYYASLLVSRAADSGPDDASGEAFEVRFLDAAGTARAAFGIGDDESFFLTGPGGGLQTEADAFDTTATSLLLFKIESRAGGAGGDIFDQVFFKAFGAGETIPALDDDLAWTLVGNLDTDETSLLDRLLITAGSGAVWSFDELRVGGSYASVTGGGTAAAVSVPEPTILMVAGAAAAATAIRRRQVRRS